MIKLQKAKDDLSSWTAPNEIAEFRFSSKYIYYQKWVYKSKYLKGFTLPVIEKKFEIMGVKNKLVKVYITTENHEITVTTVPQIGTVLRRKTKMNDTIRLTQNLVDDVVKDDVQNIENQMDSIWKTKFLEDEVPLLTDDDMKSSLLEYEYSKIIEKSDKNNG